LTIPHTHAAGKDKESLTFYYHLPPGTPSGAPVPTLILLTGLDAYRTELAVWIEGFSRLNVATIVLEIPGTGDSPADPSDPKSSDRVFSTLLDWIDTQNELDPARRACWSFSTGGFYGIRLAHTHHQRITGVVAHGGGCHYMLSPEWLSKVNHLEYPFDLATTLAYKWGYGDDLETFKREAQSKFSLLNDGTLDSPKCARLLLVNGTADEIFPVDDYYLCLQHGAPKEVRLVEGRKHMGEPESFFVILEWLYGVFGIHADPREQMGALLSKPKYV
jgi:pimeloyl-ACP methyl ester carboxylesterase